MKCPLLLLLIFITIPSLHAQEWIEGKVIDAESEQPLAFVNIIFPQSGGGVNSDIDGSFRFQASANENTIVFSYLGYKRDTLSLHEVRANPTIRLESNAYKISEVTVLPGVNPAHRIIEAAIANKDQNNPEKATDFSYDSYNKMIFSAEPDSAYLSLPDSIQRNDSDSYEGLQFIKKNHFFMMESVTERDHVPPTHTKEVVKASRISGMKTPFFTLIGTQLQSFSLYNDYLSLLGMNYLSPISKGSTSKYLFVLEDTLYQEEDTVFTISFRPRKGKFFDGLEGILRINTNGFAVQNFIASADDQETVDIKIQQQYEYINDQQWFPVQLNTFLTFKNVDIDDNFSMYAEGRSYLKNIRLDSRIEKNEMGNVVLKIEEGAGDKDSTYWENYRLKPLDEREQETYRLLDSVGNEINLDKKIKWMTALFRGAIQLGPVDFMLKHLLDYNGYEGFRLGMGAETNDKISKHFRLGGYGAYGFQDKAWKYGGHLKWNSLWENHLSAKASYSNDVFESGGTYLYNDWVNPFSSEISSKLFIQRMDAVEKYEVEVETHPLRDFQFTFFGNVQNRQILNEYRFETENNPIDSDNRFRLAETGVNVRFAFREKFIEMFGVKTPISYNYPVVYLKYSRGYNDLLDGDFAYNRLDLKVHKNFRLRNLGFTSLRFRAGYIDRNLPLSILYRARGSFQADIPFASDYSFQTAMPNEFFNDQYAAFFFKHTFKNLLFETKIFKPELALVASAGYGKMHRRETHQEVDFSSMEAGLFESGIQIDCLFGFVDWGFEQIGMEGMNFGNLGVGIFFRHGPYSEKVFWDNAVFKVTSTVKF